MGEYYKPCVLTSHKRTAPNKTKVKAYIHCHDFDTGLKLLEFGYIGTHVMNIFETLINEDNGPYAGLPVVVAGDYDNDEPYKLNGEKWNVYSLASEFGERISPEFVQTNNINPKHYRYLINRTKGVYIDTNRVKADRWGWKIHPLVILCADDEPKGGGSYWGKNQRMMRSWRRNVVVTSDNKPENYREVFYDFKEG